MRPLNREKANRRVRRHSSRGHRQQGWQMLLRRMIVQPGVLTLVRAATAHQGVGFRQHRVDRRIHVLAAARVDRRSKRTSRATRRQMTDLVSERQVPPATRRRRGFRWPTLWKAGPDCPSSLATRCSLPDQYGHRCSHRLQGRHQHRQTATSIGCSLVDRPHHFRRSRRVHPSQENSNCPSSLATRCSLPDQYGHRCSHRLQGRHQHRQTATSIGS